MLNVPDLEKTGKTSTPASWCDAPSPAVERGASAKRDSVVNGYSNGSSHPASTITAGKYVRTVYGAIPLQHALNWPVIASFDELSSCANWMGGRIPTMEEVRSIYSYVEHTKAPEFEKALGNTIPAVNGYVAGTSPTASRLTK